MEKIIDIILNQIKEYNETADTPLDISAGKDSVIFGKESPLDSVGFVNLMLDIEQALGDEFQKSVIIADARAMSQKKSPFRTVQTLAEYVKEQV